MKKFVKQSFSLLLAALLVLSLVPVNPAYAGTGVNQASLAIDDSTKSYTNSNLEIVKSEGSYNNSPGKYYWYMQATTNSPKTITWTISNDFMTELNGKAIVEVECHKSYNLKAPLCYTDNLGNKKTVEPIEVRTSTDLNNLVSVFLILDGGFSGTITEGNDNESIGLTVTSNTAFKSVTVNKVDPAKVKASIAVNEDNTVQQDEGTVSGKTSMAGLNENEHAYQIMAGNAITFKGSADFLGNVTGKAIASIRYLTEKGAIFSFVYIDAEGKQVTRTTPDSVVVGTDGFSTAKYYLSNAGFNGTMINSNEAFAIRVPAGASPVYVKSIEVEHINSIPPAETAGFCVNANNSINFNACRVESADNVTLNSTYNMYAYKANAQTVFTVTEAFLAGNNGKFSVEVECYTKGGKDLTFAYIDREGNRQYAERAATMPSSNDGFTILVYNISDAGFTGGDILNGDATNHAFGISVPDDGLQVGIKSVTITKIPESSELDLTMNRGARTLSLQDTILFHTSVSFVDSTGQNTAVLTKEYIKENGRMLFWSAAKREALGGTDEALLFGTQTESAKFNLTENYNGVTEYYAYSHGIPAKEYNDTVYYRSYIVIDGATYYSDVFNYSVVTYCMNKLDNTDAESIKLKPLLAAILNYGAAAQNHFDYNTSNLANADLQKLVDEDLLDEDYLYLERLWNNRVLPELTEPDTEKTRNFTQTESGIVSFSGYTLSLQGEVQIVSYITYKPNNPADKAGEPLPPGSKITFYYWTADTYNSADQLTKDNADDIKTVSDVICEYDEKEGYGHEYIAYKGVYAKNLGDTLYVAAVVELNSEVYCSGVIPYSAVEYARKQIEKADPDLANLVKWMVIYGDAADQYFP